MKLFHNRSDAGIQLAEKLANYHGRDDVILLALPRGGVPVAAAMAEMLELPMDIWLVRKLGVPGFEELAMGAIAHGGVCYVNPAVIRRLGITQTAMDKVLKREADELARRNRVYREGRDQPSLKGKTVLIIDDGLATGATMRAAIASLKETDAARVEVAVPVASPITCASLKEKADKIYCLRTPESFFGVGQWYENFDQVSDEEVRQLLTHKKTWQQAA